MVGSIAIILAGLDQHDVPDLPGQHWVPFPLPGVGGYEIQPCCAVLCLGASGQRLVYPQSQQPNGAMCPLEHIHTDIHVNKHVMYASPSIRCTIFILVLYCHNATNNKMSRYVKDVYTHVTSIPWVC